MEQTNQIDQCQIPTWWYLLGGGVVIAVLVSKYSPQKQQTIPIPTPNTFPKLGAQEPTKKEDLLQKPTEMPIMPNFPQREKELECPDTKKLEKKLALLEYEATSADCNAAYIEWNKLVAIGAENGNETNYQMCHSEARKKYLNEIL